MTDRRYVFISYARQDWARVEPFVNRLKAENIDIWIDHSDLPATQCYPEALVAAVRASTVFLLFQTTGATDSPHVRSEVTTAHDSNKKMVRIPLDALDSDNFKYQFAGVPVKSGMNDVTSATFSGFCAELKDLLRKPHQAKRNGDDGLATLLPYLADRTEQEGAVKNYLKQVCDSDGRQVGFYLIQGPLMQCVDSLVERFVHHTLPTTLQRYELSDTVTELRVEWPASSSEASSVKARLDELGDCVAKRLHLPPGSAPAAIAAGIARHNAVVVTCELPFNDWCKADVDLLRQWADWWAALPSRQPKRPLLVLMYLPYGAEWPRTTIRQFFAALAVARDRTRIRSVIAAFDQIRNAYRNHPNMVAQAVPPLASLRSVDAMNWARDHLNTVDKETLRREFGQLFRRPSRLGARPLPMEPVAVALKDLLRRNRAIGEAS